MAKKEYKLACIAITDKRGDIHYKEKISYDENGKVVVEPVILSEDLLTPEIIEDYLESGHIVEHVAEEKAQPSNGTDRDQLAEEYKELSGKKRIPGTWGVAKLKEEIENLKNAD